MLSCRKSPRSATVYSHRTWKMPEKSERLPGLQEERIPSVFLHLRWRATVDSWKPWSGLCTGTYDKGECCWKVERRNQMAWYLQWLRIAGRISAIVLQYWSFMPLSRLKKKSIFLLLSNERCYAISCASGQVIGRVSATSFTKKFLDPGFYLAAKIDFNNWSFSSIWLGHSSCPLQVSISW